MRSQFEKKPEEQANVTLEIVDTHELKMIDLVSHTNLNFDSSDYEDDA